jgi:hypothetical protein
MPNAMLKMVDSDQPLSLSGVLQSLSEVPFAQHQYRWLIGEINRHPIPSSSVMLAGYCGARRLPAARRARFDEACMLIAGMSQSQIGKLPERINPAPPPPQIPPPSSPAKTTGKKTLAAGIRGHSGGIFT